MKEDCPPSSHVPISDSKSILKSELLSLLKTYNCYHEGRSFQLRHREEEGALIIEGLLNIAWGLRRPIRLQIQDDRERVHLSAASWTPGQPSCHLKEPLLQDGKVAAQEPNAQTAPSTESSRDSSEPVEEDEETPQLMRTKSDAACVIQRRPRSRTPGEAQRIRRHRFSINGHFYNHKTSVFTPAYGSVTNVRVNSTMTTLHVLTLLLNKFRIMKTKVAVHLAGSMAVLLGQGATTNASARPKPSHPLCASQNPKGSHHLQPRSVGRGWGMCVGVRELELKVPPQVRLPYPHGPLYSTGLPLATLPSLLLPRLLFLSDLGLCFVPQSHVIPGTLLFQAWRRFLGPPDIHFLPHSQPGTMRGSTHAP
ncbi:ras association domain-containing protein 4 isoform X1 [Prionailurus viverrinus]|uniref:ras association domain-containing protein 4 isoform X1 n=1 Tax=Prionailurus viverrinus TaxID=61388 RepID=UPI001FF6BCDD|nr:ras association domain-containing protein 4 isoform X1 [Prionailurus viverrinus]